MNATTVRRLSLDELEAIGNEIVNVVKATIRPDPGVLHLPTEPDARVVTMIWRGEGRSLHLDLGTTERYGINVALYRGDGAQGDRFGLIYTWDWRQDDALDFKVVCSGGWASTAPNHEARFLDLESVAVLPGTDPTKPEMITEIIKVVAEELTNLRLV